MIKEIIERSILLDLFFENSIKQPNFYRVWLFYKVFLSCYRIMINGNLMPVVLSPRCS